MVTFKEMKWSTVPLVRLRGILEIYFSFYPLNKLNVNSEKFTIQLVCREGLERILFLELSF